MTFTKSMLDSLIMRNMVRKIISFYLDDMKNEIKINKMVRLVLAICWVSLIWQFVRCVLEKRQALLQWRNKSIMKKKMVKLY